MKFNETNATARRIYIQLKNAGIPVTGFTPSVGQLKLSLSGDSVANGAGTWHEIGYGLYYYECTNAETLTLSYIMLIIIAGGVDVFSWIEDVGTRIAVGETSTLRTRIPIFLLNGSSVVTGAPLVSETQVSVNGAALTAPGGTFGESGSGAYYYQPSSSEIAALGRLTVQVTDPAVTYVYSQDVVDVPLFTSLAIAGKGYFGSYFGGSGVTATTPVTPPTPVAITTVADGLVVINHADDAIDRLCEYAKAKSP
jgi:hypothetical protein